MYMSNSEQVTHANMSKQSSTSLQVAGAAQRSHQLVCHQKGALNQHQMKQQR